MGIVELCAKFDEAERAYKNCLAVTMRECGHTYDVLKEARAALLAKVDEYMRRIEAINSPQIAELAYFCAWVLRRQDLP